MEGIGKENHRRERREEGEGGDALDYSPRADTLRHCAPLSEHAISDAGISRTSDNYCPNGARMCQDRITRFLNASFPDRRYTGAVNVARDCLPQSLVSTRLPLLLLLIIFQQLAHRLLQRTTRLSAH